MIKEEILKIWDSVRGNTSSPLLIEIGKAMKDAPITDDNFKGAHFINDFSKRIAESEKDSDIVALQYRMDYVGEWTVSNHDLQVWGIFILWLHRSFFKSAYLFVQGITKALKNKRLSQAYTRYQKTGLTEEHCKLLENMLWDMGIPRPDLCSLYVQGKRPFGNSSIEYDIFEHLGWEMNWGEDDDDMPLNQEERAWDIFDELVFAIVDAVKQAKEGIER